MTEADWAEAKALYETGKMTKTQLAEKYGKHRNTISEGLNKRGAVYGSKSKVVEEATIEAVRDEQTKRREEIAAMKERQRQRVEVIQGLAIKQITDQVRDRKPLADRKGDMSVLKMAISIVAIGRDQLYHIYDLYDDPDSAEEQPEFIVSEYTPDEIDKLNRQRLGEVDEEDLDGIIADIAAPTEEADPLGDLLDGAL